MRHADDRLKMRTMIVRLPPEMDDALRARAAADDRTIAQTIRRALRFYLEAGS